ncbi:MAG: DUF3179 domain-containing (seleno)protein, partial [Candidatus Methylomirabilia bacterium]
SLWSHVTGKAVAGPLKGMRLTMLPAVHTTWGLWKASHPESVVLQKRGWSLRNPRAWETEYALGLVVEGAAMGFPFAELKRTPLAELSLAGQPLLVVYIDQAATAVAFRRQVKGRLLTFHSLAPEGELWRIQDRETGSRWNAITGEALSGPLAGATLPPLPATQAYLSSWRELYPRGAIWRAE